MEKYRNRQEAGKVLASALVDYADHSDILVLALPRGGVPVAFVVAETLHVPMDVFIVRKLGVPGHAELAMGAIAMGSAPVLNKDIMHECQVTPHELEAVIAKEKQELQRRELAYRGQRAFPDITDKTIILVDDGIATGATMRAAIKALRTRKAGSIIVAVPVTDASLCGEIQSLVDAFICPLRPSQLQAVGVWYEDFAQTEDAEVYALLEAARKC